MMFRILFSLPVRSAPKKYGLRNSVEDIIVCVYCIVGLYENTDSGYSGGHDVVDHIRYTSENTDSEMQWMILLSV